MARTNRLADFERATADLFADQHVGIFYDAYATNEWGCLICGAGCSPDFADGDGPEDVTKEMVHARMEHEPDCPVGRLVALLDGR